MKKNILIVGGAGYIGSHVAKLLGERGFNTIVLDNLSRGCRDAVVNGLFVFGDKGDQKTLDDLFSSYQFDAAYDFAALTDVGESIVRPSLYYKKNVVDTLNFLDHLLKHRVRTYIFSSTAAVYGLPEQAKITENHPCRPINPYGQTKLMVEHILADYDRAYGLKSCCFRYFNAAGWDEQRMIRWHHRKENNLIPILLGSLLESDQKSVTVNGTDFPTNDGSCVRDYIHVTDLASAHVMALERLMATQQSDYFNLGNARGYSVLEVVKAVERVTGKPLKVIMGPRRPGDPAVLVADASKAQKELSWYPRYTDLEEMISHYWQAMKKC